jgi:cellulose biosynthesis protein BcsQ
MKGGVGKSTATANLAFLAAAGGEPTLAWDLDAQGASTYQLRGAPGEPIRPRRLLSGRSSLSDHVVPTRYPGLDIVPAGMGLRRLDGLLYAHRGARSFVRDTLRPWRDTYRWVFLDCPAGITRLTEAVMKAADIVLVPVIPNPLSRRAYESLVAFLEQREWTVHVVPFFSHFDARSRVHREEAATFRAREPFLCATVIPRRAEVEAASARGRPVVVGRAASASARAYRALWDELRGLPEALHLAARRPRRAD